LTAEQWTRVIETVTARALVPFLDIAYQGFGDGLDGDAAPVRRFARADVPVFVSNSFSKSFSLYGERVGALSVVAASSDEVARVLSQLKRLVRTNYSNPPTHGGKVVAAVLADPELRSLWERELGQMRSRIHSMRLQFVEKMQARVPGADFGFVARQRGMFSYSGLSQAAVKRLGDEFSVYAVDTGRICVAALNSHNLDYVTEAIARVI
jgi:aromatic-amino-acid transaminase